MLNRMKATQLALTDFNVGAVGRTLIEAPAIEIDELYQQMFIGLKEAIPVSIYQAFNFPPLSAFAATGTVSVTIAASTSATVINAGTAFTSAVTANVYIATGTITIPAGGTSANVPVAATAAGAASNLVQNVAFSVTPAPKGFVSASNPAAFINGQDQETAAEQQVRFAAYIAALPRGIVAALYYGLSLANVLDANGNVIEKAVYANVIEPYLTDATQPVALVNCIIHNGVGNTSAALVSSAQDILFGYYDASGNAVPGYKGAGVKVTVGIAAEVPVNVAGTIVPLPGISLTDQVVNGATVPGLNTLASSAIFAYLQSRPIKQPALMAEITALVMALPGVFNYLPTLPVADVTVTGLQKIMPGTITL
ncbi:MAG TPA: baseplate J/gp47 family protein [Burkholderiaceae bacterium]